MIPINRLYHYREIERVTAPNGFRHYVCPDTGEKLPSVTTILDKTADKQHLIEWRERVGEEAAERIKKEATGLGGLMHTHLENWVQGIARPGGTNLVRQMASRMADVIIKRGLPAVEEVWGMEVALHFPYLYAGTTDLVGVWNGKPAIMDYKTAKKLRTRDQIVDYFNQGVAYCLAHNWQFDTDIKTVVIFMVDRDCNFREFVLEGGEFNRTCDQWQERLDVFHEMGIMEAA